MTEPSDQRTAVERTPPRDPSRPKSRPDQSAADPGPINRRLVGLLALIGLVGGAAILVFSSPESQFGGALLRTGLLLAALWLALPSKRWPAAWANLSPWSIVGFAGLCLLAGRYKYVFLGGIAFMVVAGILLKPRRRR